MEHGNERLKVKAAKGHAVPMDTEASSFANHVTSWSSLTPQTLIKLFRPCSAPYRLSMSSRPMRTRLDCCSVASLGITGGCPQTALDRPWHEDSLRPVRIPYYMSHGQNSL